MFILYAQASEDYSTLTTTVFSISYIGLPYDLNKTFNKELRERSDADPPCHIYLCLNLAGEFQSFEKDLSTCWTFLTLILLGDLRGKFKWLILTIHRSLYNIKHS